jgi:ankyrin repeat protein
LIINFQGETPLHLACNINKGQLHFPKEDVQIVEILLQKGGGESVQKMTSSTRESPLHYVASNGNIDVLDKILQHLDGGQVQLAVNTQSAIGWSPLCAASANGHLKCVALMLTNHGRVDVFDHEGKSSLHLAAENGSENVCKELLEANAFVNSKTKSGWTALHFAAQKGHADLADYLVRKKAATLDATTMKKQTPLHLAATSGKIEVCYTECTVKVY